MKFNKDYCKIPKIPSNVLTLLAIYGILRTRWEKRGDFHPLPYGEVKMGANQNKLRRIRTTEGLKITELSRLSNVNEKTIREIEKSRRESTEVTKRKILRALNENRHRKEEYSYDEVFSP